jgi:DNA-binding transcriptional regulator YhcF (GntR family)
MTALLPQDDPRTSEPADAENAGVRFTEIAAALATLQYLKSHIDKVRAAPLLTGQKAVYFEAIFQVLDALDRGEVSTADGFRVSPSTGDLAEATGCKPFTVRKHLRELTRRKYLALFEVVGGRGQKNQIEVPVDQERLASEFNHILKKPW